MSARSAQASNPVARTPTRVSSVRLNPDEELRATLKPRWSSVLFPVLELLLISGIIWLFIGMVDAYFASASLKILGYETQPLTQIAAHSSRLDLTILLWVRRALLLLWVALAWQRCLRHVISQQRSRLILTNQRLIRVSGALRLHVASVPFDLVEQVTYRRGTLTVGLYSPYHSWTFKDIAQGKKFASLMNQEVFQRRRAQAGLY